MNLTDIKSTLDGLTGIFHSANALGSAIVGTLLSLLGGWTALATILPFKKNLSV